MRRALAAITIASLLAGGCSRARGQGLTVTLRNTFNLGATAQDQHGQSFTVTGLSGIAQRGGDEFWAVMDNSNKIVKLSIQIASNGSITAATVQTGLSLGQSRDFEGIAFEPNTGHILLAEETTPAVRRFDALTGEELSVIEAPPVFASMRPNFGLESLGARPSGFWTANEEALTVDGAASSPSSGTLVRLVKYAGAAGQYSPVAQYAYVTQSWHGSSISGARSGVSDVLELPDGHILILERSFAFSLLGFFQTRIYELDLTSATDVSSLPGLIGQPFTAARKRLLYQGDQQNLEGIALGPLLGPGRYSLLGIVDDGDPISVNRVVAFELSGVGPPPCSANCDGSTSAPVLNANDFACFLNLFAQQSASANCDGSIAPPTLNAADFACFLNQFAAGC